MKYALITYIIARMLWGTMLIHHGDYWFSAFTWVASPLIPVIILGLYLVDITDGRA